MADQITQPPCAFLTLCKSTSSFCSLNPFAFIVLERYRSTACATAAVASLAWLNPQVEGFVTPSVHDARVRPGFRKTPFGRMHKVRRAHSALKPGRTARISPRVPSHHPSPSISHSVGLRPSPPSRIKCSYCASWEPVAFGIEATWTSRWAGSVRSVGMGGGDGSGGMRRPCCV